jgi:hypothetical protein
MSSSSAPASAARPRQFQFTLATLLITMAWVGFLCLALRQPTAFWLGLMFLLTLLIMLVSVLVVVYRTGRARAFATGFLVFGVGYLTCLTLVAGGLSDVMLRGWTPVQGASVWLFDRLHPPKVVPATAAMGPGGGMPGMMGSPDGGYGMPGGMGGGMGGEGDMTGGGYAGGYGGPGMGYGSSSGSYTVPPPFEQKHFSGICNLAMSCLLGVLGGIVAQWLYATRRD